MNNKFLGVGWFDTGSEGVGVEIQLGLVDLDA